MPSFVQGLHSVFGKERVKIAPVKQLERSRVKVMEAREQGPPPYASYLCDYLRATVLCQRIEDMVSVLQTLCEKYQVVRIKRRILPTDIGNKVILLNLVVEDPSIVPRQYKWSDWWKAGEVKMIAEVFTLFFVFKNEVCY